MELRHQLPMKLIGSICVSAATVSLLYAVVLAINVVSYHPFEICVPPSNGGCTVPPSTALTPSAMLTFIFLLGVAAVGLIVYWFRNIRSRLKSGSPSARITSKDLVVGGIVLIGQNVANWYLVMYGECAPAVSCRPDVVFTVFVILALVSLLLLLLLLLVPPRSEAPSAFGPCRT